MFSVHFSNNEQNILGHRWWWSLFCKGAVSTRLHTPVSMFHAVSPDDGGRSMHETSVNFDMATRHSIPEHNHLHIRCRGNLKSYEAIHVCCCYCAHESVQLDQYRATGRMAGVRFPTRFSFRHQRVQKGSEANTASYPMALETRAVLGTGRAGWPPGPRPPLPPPPHHFIAIREQR